VKDEQMYSASIAKVCQGKSRILPCEKQVTALMRRENMICESPDEY
jgi:hypothetical protein